MSTLLPGLRADGPFVRVCGCVWGCVGVEGYVGVPPQYQQV